MNVSRSRWTSDIPVEDAATDGHKRPPATVAPLLSINLTSMLAVLDALVD